MPAVTCLTAYAALTPVTSRIEVNHPGTVGDAYSSPNAVNTSLYNSTRFYYTSSVSNKPTTAAGFSEYSGVLVTGKLYKNSSVFSTVFNQASTHVGNTSSTGTVVSSISSGYKSYGKLNDMFKTYIKIELCPPAYYYYSTFNFGGVFYGVS